MQHSYMVTWKLELLDDEKSLGRGMRYMCSTGKLRLLEATTFHFFEAPNKYAYQLSEYQVPIGIVITNLSDDGVGAVAEEIH